MNTLKSSVKPADSMTQAFRIVLHTTASGELVTHCENVRLASWSEAADMGEDHKGNGNVFVSKNCHDYYWGHYFRDDSHAALADYQARCKQYGLKP